MEKQKEIVNLEKCVLFLSNNSEYLSDKDMPYMFSCLNSYCECNIFEGENMHANNLYAIFLFCGFVWKSDNSVFSKIVSNGKIDIGLIAVYFGYDIYKGFEKLRRNDNAKKQRQRMVMCSNNAANPNKNICAHKVTTYLGVANRVKYLHTQNDVLRAVKKEYNAYKARFSRVPTISEIIAYYKQNPTTSPYLLLFVESHVLLLNGNGRVLCDTDKGKYSEKKVLKLYELDRK